VNRHQRRALERQLKPRTLAHPVPASVALEGGPMDGYVVKPDAPALRPDWFRTWPPTVAARFAPGAYAPAVADARGVRRSTWQEGAGA
jgi:hypothetical protein